MTALLSFLQFELKAATRRGAELLQAPFFLAMGAMCFPLASTPEQAASYGEPILWVLLLLSSLMSTHTIWDEDAASGALEQYRFYPLSALEVVVVKYAVYWLCYALPALLTLPLLGLLLQSAVPYGVMIAGSLLLSAIGFLSATLTISPHQSPIIRALLCLPLYMPVLIFGAGGNALMLAGLALIYTPLSLMFSGVLLKHYID